MSDLRDLRDATRARPDAVDRVKRRLEGELSAADIGALLRTVRAPGPDAAARVKAAIPHQPRPIPRRTPVVVGGLLLGGLAVAAALIAMSRDRAPIALDVGLTRDPVALAGLTLRPDGRGHIGGTDVEPAVAWDAGSLAVEVDPAAGLHLGVHTREADVVVTGTGFDVERGPLGTRIDLHHGAVTVNCLLDGTHHALAPGEGVTCWPVSGDGLLGRARALERGRAPVAERLAAIDAGLATADATPLAHDELDVLRVVTLAELDPAAALSAARTYLATDRAHRRDAVQQVAAAVALQLEGCDGARPHLEALAGDSDEARTILKTCGGS